VERGKLPLLALADTRQLALGNSVVAIGSPGSTFGMLEHTVTRGIVSGIRELPAAGAESQMLKFVQTDAALNPGNSGGPLIDGRGRVVGIVTKKDLDPDKEGLSFALAADEVLKAFEVLRS
jgi:putative serine protease PepD